MGKKIKNDINSKLEINLCFGDQTTSMNTKNILKYNLKQLRLIAGYSQDEVSKISGLSRRAYQALEKGIGNPTLKSLTSLAHCFGVSVEELFRLGCLRIDGSLNLFLEKFIEQFDNDPDLIGMRTVEGVQLWWNKAVGGRVDKEPQKPLHLLSYYKDNKEYHDIIFEQLSSEKKGLSKPYLIYAPKGSLNYIYRVYPTLIYNKISSTPVWTATVAMPTDKETPNAYSNYAGKLLELAQAL